jgi:hypothetical protein
MQPAGTVNLLSTSIDASTRPSQQLDDDRSALALEHHRQLLRSAFAAHDGPRLSWQHRVNEEQALFRAAVNSGLEHGGDPDTRLHTLTMPGWCDYRHAPDVRSGWRTRRSSPQARPSMSRAARRSTTGSGSCLPCGRRPKRATADALPAPAR